MEKEEVTIDARSCILLERILLDFRQFFVPFSPISQWFSISIIYSVVNSNLASLLPRNTQEIHAANSVSDFCFWVQAPNRCCRAQNRNSCQTDVPTQLTKFSNFPQTTEGNFKNRMRKFSVVKLQRCPRDPCQ